MGKFILLNTIQFRRGDNNRVLGFEQVFTKGGEEGSTIEDLSFAA